MKHDWEYDGHDAHKGEEWWRCKNCNEREWWNEPPDEMFNGGCKPAPIKVNSRLEYVERKPDRREVNQQLKLLDAKLEKVEKLLKEALEILVK
jgi:hypothetical protein